MYQSIDITGRGSFGYITFKSPKSIGFTVNANEFSILTLAVVVTRAGTLMPVQNGTLYVETSPDGGQSWRPVLGSMEPITGTGTFIWKISPEAGIIYTTCRATCTAPLDDADCFYVVEAVYQNKLSPSDPSFIKTEFSGSISATTGFTKDGTATNVIEDTVDPGNNAPLPAKVFHGNSPVSSSNPLPVTTGGGQMVTEAYDTVLRNDVTPLVTHYTYTLAGVTQAVVKVTFDTANHTKIMEVTRL